MRRARLHGLDGSVTRLVDLPPAPYPAPRVILDGARVYYQHEAQTDPVRVMVYLETAALRMDGPLLGPGERA